MSDFINALAAGTRARLDREQLDQMDRRRSAAPHVSAAMNGDQSAIGRIAEVDPEYAIKIGSLLQGLDANKQAVLKRAADFTTQAGMGILNAPAGERPAAFEAARVEAQRNGIPTESWPKAYDANAESWLKFNVNKAIPVATWFNKQNKGTGTAPAPYDPPSWAMPGGGQPAPSPAPSGGGAPPVGPKASASPTAGPPAAPPVQQASAAPPGFKAVGYRQPDGSIKPAMFRGEPLYRNAQGELVGASDIQQASAPPIAEGTGLPVAQGDGGPPGSPSGGGPQQGGVVSAVPPGYEPRTRGGVPEIDKKGFITLISRDGPPLLISARELAKPPKAEKPQAPLGTQGPFAGQGIEGQLYNTIMQQKVDTPEYAIAYARLSRGHTTIGEDGKPLTIPGMDLSAFPAPTYRAQGAALPRLALRRAFLSRSRVTPSPVAARASRSTTPHATTSRRPAAPWRWPNCSSRSIRRSAATPSTHWVSRPTSPSATFPRHSVAATPRGRPSGGNAIRCCPTSSATSYSAHR